MGASFTFKALFKQPKMKLLFLLFASALALPRPAEDAAEVVAEKAAEVAEEVVEEVAAEAVADEPVAPAAIPLVYTGLPYVHAYAGYPYTALSYAGLPTLTAAVPKAEAKAAEPAKPVASPVLYSGGYTYPYGLTAYPYLSYHTGCVNNVGSVVPCA